MTDLQIVDLYWQRNEEAIRMSDQKYGSYCFTIANHILSDDQDAEECVSDTWLRAWNAMPPQRPNKLKLFFVRITRNLSIDKLKARVAQKRGGGEISLVLEELEQCISGVGNAENAYMAKELGKTINAFVRTLPERERNLFIRRYFYSEPLGQIAEKYHLTAHNATVILSRVRQKLKNYLEQEGFYL